METDVMNKKAILLRRGFSPEEIQSGFSEMKKWDWQINTITREEVLAVPEDDPKAVDDMAKRLFAMDSVDNRISARYLDDPFEVYMQSKPYVPPASILEPYIARLVRILNHIGVYTCMSCDGWHAEAGDRVSFVTKREMKLWMRDRYSVLWMWLLMEFVFGERWIRSRAKDDKTWLNIWEPDRYISADFLQIGLASYDCLMLCRLEDGKEMEVYEKNDRYAAFLEKHKDRICAIRNKWVNGLAKEEEDPDDLNFMKVRRRILAYVQADLENLA